MPAADRQRARRQLRERRTARPIAEREAIDTALFAAVDALLDDVLAGLPLASRRALVAAYWPMPGEPDVRPAMRRWWRAGRGLLLPRVAARDAPLAFLPWTPGERLGAGPFGTWEPADAPARVPDLMVIPCLGFDERGYRLGYGGGFYDRSLAALDAAGASVVAIGVAPECAAMSAFEPGPHDRPLDWIVTESRRIRGRARG